MRSSAASDVYKRQGVIGIIQQLNLEEIIMWIYQIL
jgi:hypothetical protein